MPNEGMRLKPCPFCGGIPETKVIVTQSGGGEDHITFTVYCPVCGVYKSKTSYRTENGYKSAGSVRTFEDVIETMDLVTGCWNQRAKEAADA